MNLINFNKAIRHLERMKKRNDEFENKDSDEILKEAVRESLLQRFEFSVDAAWKSLNRYFVEEEVFSSSMGPKTTFRKAGEFGLIDTEKWLAYLASRNDTSHGYDEEKAEGVIEIIADFIKDAESLLSKLKNKTESENK